MIITTQSDVVLSIRNKINARRSNCETVVSKRRSPPASITLGTIEGAQLSPLRISGRYHVFSLAAATRHVFIRSSTFRPSRDIGPFIDDRRNLGVLIGKITMYQPARTVDIELHHQQPELTGWSVIENPQMRWTTGCGIIDLEGVTHFWQDSLLSVEVMPIA